MEVDGMAIGEPSSSSGCPYMGPTTAVCSPSGQIQNTPPLGQELVPFLSMPVPDMVKRYTKGSWSHVQTEPNHRFKGIQQRCPCRKKPVSCDVIGRTCSQ